MRCCFPSRRKEVVPIKDEQTQELITVNAQTDNRVNVSRSTTSEENKRHNSKTAVIKTTGTLDAVVIIPARHSLRTNINTLNQIRNETTENNTKKINQEDIAKRLRALEEGYKQLQAENAELKSSEKLSKTTTTNLQRMFRMSDGLDKPMHLLSLNEHYANDFQPSLDVKQLLKSLPDNKFPSNCINQLFQAFEELPNQQSNDELGLNENDRLAIFAYSYELKDLGSANREIQLLRGDALANRLEQISISSGIPIANNLLQYICEKDVKGPELQSSPHNEKMKDIDPRSIELLNWIQSPSADYSWEFQIYKEINISMSEYNDIMIYKELIYHINAALSKLKPKKSLVFRGVGGIADNTLLYSPGRIVAFPSFSITSKSTEIATKFIGSHKSGIIFLIETSQGRPIDMFSPFPDEQEIILPPNSAFRVKGFVSSEMRRLLGVSDHVQAISMTQLSQQELESEKLFAKSAEFFTNGDVVKHDELLVQAYTEYPDTVGGLYAMGSLYGFTTKPDFRKALEYFTKVLDKAPDHLLCLCDYATMLFKLGDLHSAELYYRKALKVDPNHVATLDWYKSLLNKMGRNDESREIERRWNESKDNKR